MMNSASNERNCSKKNDNDGIDRLSELSDEILLHILSFLPILDAVRTMSIRRFGKLWTLLPSLQFDDRKFIRSSLFSGRRMTAEDYIPRFVNFVRNVLILHKNVSLDKFILSLVYMSDNHKLLSKEIVTWLGFAIDRQVKELIVKLDAIDLDVPDTPYIMPRGLFISQSLVTLDILGEQIGEPSHVHMPSLKTLSLNAVEVTNEGFKKIVSGCPSLQAMYLSDVTGLNELRFIAPNIQELHLIDTSGLLDCPNLKILYIDLKGPPIASQLEVVDVSSVQEVCINIRLREFDIFYGLLKDFCNAEVFKYSAAYFQYSDVEKLDFPQTRWKRLHIESQLACGRFLAICNVLRSSPHLEELIVTEANIQYNDPRYSDTYILSLELPPCLMRQLKTITLRGYAVPCHGLLRLAEFLLINSVTLEEMVIFPSKKMNASVGDILTFLKKLSSFRRASTNARVIFGSERCTIMQDQDPEVLRWALLG